MPPEPLAGAALWSSQSWRGRDMKPGATKRQGSGGRPDRFPSPAPGAPLRPPQEQSPRPPNPLGFHMPLTWRTVPMRVRAGVGGRPMVPQGGVPLTAVRGGKRQGASELRVGGGWGAQCAGSRQEPPPCCGERMLSSGLAGPPLRTGQGSGHQGVVGLSLGPPLRWDSQCPHRASSPRPRAPWHQLCTSGHRLTEVPKPTGTRENLGDPSLSQRLSALSWSRQSCPRSPRVLSLLWDVSYWVFCFPQPHPALLSTNKM